MAYRYRFSYGVSGGEVGEFGVCCDSVRRFAGRYGNDGTRFLNLRAVCMFFKWLRVVKGVDLSPDEFVDLLAEKRSKLSRKERLWGLDLALAFSRDNPDFKGASEDYKRGKLFLPLKMFCAANEVSLTSDRGFFGNSEPRKWEEKAFTVSFAKKVLGVLNQRNRAICMTMLQSGQSIQQVLVDVNRQADYVLREIDDGKQRIRLDFNGRKGNHFRYFSFISQDAIQEINKWRVIREEWLRKAGKTSKWLFISRNRLKPVSIRLFQSTFKQLLQRHKVWTEPYSVRTHMFRKIFEQEASPPDRGISKLHVLFMMGHSSGKRLIHKMDMVGGTYDQSPWIYNSVEREYEKLEPFINIYSGRATEASEGLSREEVEAFRKLLEAFKNGSLKLQKKDMDI